MMMTMMMTMRMMMMRKIMTMVTRKKEEKRGARKSSDRWETQPFDNLVEGIDESALRKWLRFAPELVCELICELDEQAPSTIRKLC